MKSLDVLRLLDAGYTKDEIAAMYAEPDAQKTVDPPPASTTEEQPETPPAKETAGKEPAAPAESPRGITKEEAAALVKALTESRDNELLTAIKGLTAAVQFNNLASAGTSGKAELSLADVSKDVFGGAK